MTNFKYYWLNLEKKVGVVLFRSFFRMEFSFLALTVIYLFKSIMVGFENFFWKFLQEFLDAGYTKYICLAL